MYIVCTDIQYMWFILIHCYSESIRCVMITNLALQPNSSKGSRFQSCRFPGCFHSGLSPPPHLETQQGLLLYVRCKNVLVPGLVGAQLWQTLLPLNTIWHYLVCSPLICSSMLQRSSSAPVTGHFWSHLFFRIHNFKCQDVSRCFKHDILLFYYCLAKPFWTAWNYIPATTHMSLCKDLCIPEVLTMQTNPKTLNSGLQWPSQPIFVGNPCCSCCSCYIICPCQYHPEHAARRV